MDPYTTPSSTTARPVTGTWSRRTTAVLVGLFVLVNLLSAASVVRVYFDYGGEWFGNDSPILYAYASLFVFRAVAGTLYFFRVRWFFWLIVGLMLVVYVVPSQMLPLTSMNGPASVALVLAIGLGLARSGHRYLLPWRKPYNEGGG